MVVIVVNDKVAIVLLCRLSWFLGLSAAFRFHLQIIASFSGGATILKRYQRCWNTAETLSFDYCRFRHGRLREWQGYIIATRGVVTLGTISLQ